MVCAVCIPILLLIVVHLGIGHPSSTSTGVRSLSELRRLDGMTGCLSGGGPFNGRWPACI